jgi:hypothetical protein
MSIRDLLPIEDRLARTLADNAIGLFLEYRDVHGYEEEAARRAAILDVVDGATMALEDDPAPTPDPDDDREDPRVVGYPVWDEASRWTGAEPPISGPSRGARAYWTARGLPVPGEEA